MIDHDLTDSIAISLEEQSNRAIDFIEDNNYSIAGAILSEWTPTSGGCLLTHYLNETLDSVTDELLYAHIEEDGIGYGTVSFVNAVQLPNDNI